MIIIPIAEYVDNLARSGEFGSAVCDSQADLGSDRYRCGCLYKTSKPTKFRCLADDVYFGPNGGKFSNS